MTQKAMRQAARRMGSKHIGSDFFHAAQCGLCPVCNQEIDLETQAVSYDHVFPLNPRGSGLNLHQGNLLLAHVLCNRNKGNRLPTASEIAVLQMVNDILRFDEATGQYGRMDMLLQGYMRQRGIVLSRIANYEKRFENLDRHVHFMEQYQYDAAKQELEQVDALIADQREVFNTYLYLHDLPQEPSN